jgi:hypothetical protein
VSEWTFLFELQWWHGREFVQRFHAWHVPGHGRNEILWERAWPLFELQQATRRLMNAIQKQRLAR